MADADRVAQQEAWECHRGTLAPLPPSAKLVAKVLALEGSLTQAELIEESLLPRRTVRYALTQLSDAGIIRSIPRCTDARQRLYSLDSD